LTLKRQQARTSDSSKRQQPHRPQMPAIGRHQPSELPEWPLLTFLPLVHTEEVTGSIPVSPTQLSGRFPITGPAFLIFRQQERQRGVPSVAASQEAVAQAAGHVAELGHLGRILSVTREFLVQAQENVHRTIAPQLADAIAPHLHTVTDGRYTQVRVDPEDLQVLVRPASGTWREASRLSHGTAEQVYLLLRAALARYLATTGEPCPLILDDPTAYADVTRTRAILEVLHNISTERHVIVFSHDPQVLAWAKQALTTPQDKVIELAESVPTQ
jgi:hypothetical protein